MYEFIKKRLKELGKTQKDLAQELNIEPPHLSAIFKGIRKIKFDEIIPMASFLGIDVMYFMEYLSGLRSEKELLEHQIRRVPFIGYVQAGAFKETYQLPKDEWSSIAFPIKGNLFKCNLFALGVIGESMNKVFMEGETLICCPLDEWLHATGEKEVGRRFVIVYCYNANGLCEATVKLYNKIDDNTVILEPMSTNPDFKPIVLHPDNNEYVVAAVVFGSVRTFNNERS